MLPTELKTGTIYKQGNQPYLVVKYSHIKTARGGATIKVRAKNLLTGRLLEESYGSSDRVEEADVARKNAQYLYSDGGGFVFMDPNTYEQFTIPAGTIGDQKKFFKEGESAQILYFDGKPVSAILPNNMTFKVNYTEPGFKGNSVTNVFKDAKIETGAVIKVPTFTKIGDTIKVDTRTGEYISKA